MILKGKNLIIKAGGVAIAAAKSCSMKVKAKQIDVSSPTDGEWEHSINGRKSWTISTDHLVLSIARPLATVGTQVSIEVGLRSSVGKPFNGFVNGVNIYPSPLSGTPTAIYWDKTAKKFVGKMTSSGSDIYFDSWTDSAAYTSPSAYDCFSYNGIVYSWLSNDLTAEKLTGTANVESWDVRGAVGNLCSGSFQFNGTGALTPATLP